MSLTPPAERIWWKEPIEGVELFWVAIALVWALVMFFMMPYWHVYGKQNLSSEAYRTTPEMFTQKVQAMVDQYTIRKETARDMPVVRPPAGADVYMLGRLWEWYPALELEKGQTYRLHLSSIDLVHGFSLFPLNLNFMVLPGYEYVLTITPTTTGEVFVVCNEFCGIGHHQMVGKITVE